MSRKTYLSQLLLTGIYMLGILGIAASGGGGDGDDDEEIVIQALYDFTVGGPLPDDPGNNSSIGIEKQGVFTLTTEPNVVGTVTCDQVTEVCELQTVDNPSNILIDDPDDTLFTGNINATVDRFWLYPSGSDRPSSGRVVISRAGQPDISAEVADCSGSPGVDVQGTTDMTDACYPWGAFEDLVDQLVVTDAVLAAFAWEIIDFTVDQARNALEVFPLIVDDSFGGANTLFENCDMYAGTWPAPAPPNPGDFLFSWFDDSGNGQVGPGDSFRQDFNDCWFGDSTDGTLLEGIIDYVGYTEVIDQNGLLTRIGFESAATGSGKIGGVAFGDELGNNPLVITETTEDIGGNITTEDPLILTGRYLIVFE